MLFGICLLSIVPMRAEPRDTSELVSQGIYGESFKIIEERSNWSLIKLTFDGYKGWIDNKQLIKIDKPTYESIILKNNKRLQYPDFYKILITQPVADQLNLQKDSPLIELIEIKKNKFFIAKKSKIFQEEKKIHSNAPVEGVIINNISQTNEKIKKVTKEKFYIIIAEFYSKNSANLLNERITRELPSFNSKKLFIKSKKTNKISLISGPYSSVNLMKNDYILFKNFGFEELDITINE